MEHARMQREHTTSPNGAVTKGAWVLRDGKDKFIDWSYYRNDLIERWGNRYEIEELA